MRLPEWLIERGIGETRAALVRDGRIIEARLLREDEIDDVVAALHRDAPENLDAFDFLIRTSANVLAAELILERQKQVFEELLKTALRTSGETAEPAGSMAARQQEPPQEDGTR